MTDYVLTKPEHLAVDHLRLKTRRQGIPKIRLNRPSCSSIFRPYCGTGRVQFQAQGHGHFGILPEKVDDADEDLDVAVQTDLYGAEMLVSDLRVNYLLNLIVIAEFVCLLRLVAFLPKIFQAM